MGKTTAQKDAHAVKDGIGQKDVYVTAVGDTTKAYFIPQQRKLLGSSAQISSGVCASARRRGRFRIPEEGSGEFRRVLV